MKEQKYLASKEQINMNSIYPYNYLRIASKKAEEYYAKSLKHKNIGYFE